MNVNKKVIKKWKDKTGHTMTTNTTISSGIFSISCQYQNVEAEVFFAHQKSTNKEFDYIYFNKVRQYDGTWFTLLNRLYKEERRKVSQSDLCAYGCKVRTENNESGSESLVEDCIKKCFSTGKRLPLTNLDDATKNLPPLPATSNILSFDIVAQFTARLNSSKFDWKKIHSIVFEAGNTKVEISLSENGSPTNLCSLTFVNKQRQSKSEWGYWLKTLWRKQAGNSSTSTYPVYIMAISYPEVNRDDVISCIKKCLAKFKEDIDKNLTTPAAIPTTTDTKETEENLPTPAAIPTVITEQMVVQLEMHLQSTQFDFKKIHSINCRKDDTQVELALSENESTTDIFQRVYVNRVREVDCKWANHLKILWHSDSTFPVYIMAITYNEVTLKDEIVINCIKKCLSNIKEVI